MTVAASIASPLASLPRDTVIPGGLGGVRADGRGGFVYTEDVRSAAVARMHDALARIRDVGVPGLTVAGDLPAGIHQATWADVIGRFRDGDRRAALTNQLERAIHALHAAGIEQVVIGGSYAGSKHRPGDVDLAVLPRRDGRFVSIPSAANRVSRVAPDVHVHDAGLAVVNAITLRGAIAGENHLELFMHGRDGAQRGVLLLDTFAPPEPELVAVKRSGLREALRGIAAVLR